MKKEIAKIYGGKNAKVADMLVNRLMPNKHVKAVGRFVFLDHFYPTQHKSKFAETVRGNFAQPHRGISTFTFVLSGETEHFDSRGNYGVAGAGGAHWMKAGSGIKHAESTTRAFQQAGGLLHMLQFWINLPAENKNDVPKYKNLQPAEIPELVLPGSAGKLRIMIGSYGSETSPIETTSEQCLYHIRLNPKSTFTLHTKVNFEYAAFVPTDEVKINNAVCSKSELIIFKQDEGIIVLKNNNITEADIIVFGGEPYTGSIVAEGPFVMNTLLQICEAYKDFHFGKYGEISYDITDVQ